MDFVIILVNLWTCFVYFARKKTTPFPKLTLIYVLLGSRTSYLRSVIHPNCGCFMVVFMGELQYIERGLLFLFIPVNQTRILQDSVPLSGAAFQS